MRGEELLRHLQKVVPKKCDIHFYSVDSQFCGPAKLPALYLLNTDYNEGEGEHFLSFYVNEKKSCIYFDSFGFSPLECLKKFWKKHGIGPVKFSSRVVQNPLSPYCGYHQVAFAALITNGGTLNSFLKILSDSTEVNDRAVVQFVKNLV